MHAEYRVTRLLRAKHSPRSSARERGYRLHQNRHYIPDLVPNHFMTENVTTLAACRFHLRSIRLVDVTTFEFPYAQNVLPLSDVRIELDHHINKQ
jgi:hypothetical protein